MERWMDESRDVWIDGWVVRGGVIRALGVTTRPDVANKPIRSFSVALEDPVGH